VIPETGQAAAAGGADAADRQPELIGYLGVGSGRIGHEQLEHPLPPPGQVRKGFANHLRPLRGEQTFIDLRFGCDRSLEDDVVIGQNHPFPGRETAQAFVTGGRREPGTHPIRVHDLMNVLQQSQPRHLGDVSRVTLDQLEIPGDGPDEPRVLVDQALPRPWVPLGSLSHKLCDVQRTGILYLPRRHPPSLSSRRNSSEGHRELGRVRGLPIGGLALNTGDGRRQSPSVRT
jgi:hypothetical protein